MTESLEVLDVFGDRTYLENTAFPSWATDWSKTRVYFTSGDLGFKRMNLHDSPQMGGSSLTTVEATALRMMGLTLDATSPGKLVTTTPLSQEHTSVGHLELNGVKIASHIQSLSSKHIIEDPVSNQRATFEKLVHIQYAKKPISSADWSRCCWLYIFPNIVNSDQGIVLGRRIVHRDMVSPEFAKYLAGPQYVRADVQEIRKTNSIRQGNSDFLVPRNASLDDVVVAFFGSAHSHLLRPLVNRPGYYRYIGPVVGLQIIGSKKSKASDDNNWHALKGIPAIYHHPKEGDDDLKEERFILV